MSSLFKRSKWTLQYHDDDRSPAKKQFSLGTTSKRTAERLQAELDDLYQRGLFDPWTDDFRDRLEELKRPDKPKTAASLQEAKDGFVESRSGLAPPTIRKYELVTRLFTEHVGPTDISAITSEDVQSFLQGRVLSITSKHVYLRHLAVFFRWCWEKGLTQQVPSDGVTLRRKPEKTPKAFTREEVKRLIEAATDYLRVLVVVGTRTGLRRSELSRLTWDNVSLEERTLQVTGQTKSGKERTIPFSAEAVAALGGLAHRRDHVFHLGSPRRPIHPDTLSHDFLRLRREVFPEKSHFSLHSLRHTFCTWLAEGGVPLHTIKQLAGHSSIDTTMQYVHALSDGRTHIERVFGSPYQKSADPAEVLS